MVCLLVPIISLSCLFWCFINIFLNFFIAITGFKFRFRSPSSIENTIVDKTETFVFDENAATVSKTALDGIYDDTGATVPKGKLCLLSES